VREENSLAQGSGSLAQGPGACDASLCFRSWLRDSRRLHHRDRLAREAGEVRPGDVTCNTARALHAARLQVSR
jgi:hypothetical protein